MKKYKLNKEELKKVKKIHTEFVEGDSIKEFEFNWILGEFTWDEYNSRMSDFDEKFAKGIIVEVENYKTKYLNLVDDISDLIDLEEEEIKKTDNKINEMVESGLYSEESINMVNLESDMLRKSSGKLWKLWNEKIRGKIS